VCRMLARRQRWVRADARGDDAGVLMLLMLRGGLGPGGRDAAVLALRSHCHLWAKGKAVRMMLTMPMIPMMLITLMMLMMVMMLVMLAMAPMLALGHWCCPHAGVAADGGGEPGGVAEVPAACTLELLAMVAASRAARWREGRADARMLGAKASAEGAWGQSGRRGARAERRVRVPL
jgi:hypothetical protein